MYFELRQRAHDRQLPAHYGYLFDCNFITRLLVHRHILINTNFTFYTVL